MLEVYQKGMCVSAATDRKQFRTNTLAFSSFQKTQEICFIQWKEELFALWEQVKHRKHPDEPIATITSLLLASDKRYKRILDDVETQKEPITLDVLILRLESQAKNK